METREQLKKQFAKGLKPTEVQFHEWLDSYWHKDDELPESNSDVYSIRCQRGMVEERYIYFFIFKNGEQIGWDTAYNEIPYLCIFPMYFYKTKSGLLSDSSNITKWRFSDYLADGEGATIDLASESKPGLAYPNVDNRYVYAIRPILWRPTFALFKSFNEITAVNATSSSGEHISNGALKITLGIPNYFSLGQTNFENGKLTAQWGRCRRNSNDGFVKAPICFGLVSLKHTDTDYTNADKGKGMSIVRGANIIARTPAEKMLIKWDMQVHYQKIEFK